MASNLVSTFGSLALLSTLGLSLGIPREITGLTVFDIVTGITTKGSTATFDEFSELFVLGGTGESTSPSLWLLASEMRGGECGFISTGISGVSFSSVGFFAGRGSFFGSWGDIASRLGDDEGDLRYMIEGFGDDCFPKDDLEGFTGFSGGPDEVPAGTFGLD